MTTEINKKRVGHIAEMLDELEYMRRVAFNNAIDNKYKELGLDKLKEYE